MCLPPSVGQWLWLTNVVNAIEADPSESGTLPDASAPGGIGNPAAQEQLGVEMASFAVI